MSQFVVPIITLGVIAIALLSILFVSRYRKPKAAKVAVLVTQTKNHRYNKRR